MKKWFNNRGLVYLILLFNQLFTFGLYFVFKEFIQIDVFYLYIYFGLIVVDIIGIYWLIKYKINNQRLFFRYAFSILYITIFNQYLGENIMFGKGSLYDFIKILITFFAFLNFTQLADFKTSMSDFKKLYFLSYSIFVMTSVFILRLLVPNYFSQQFFNLGIVILYTSLVLVEYIISKVQIIKYLLINLIIFCVFLFIINIHNILLIIFTYIIFLGLTFIKNKIYLNDKSEL